jgi:hypothetical protein
MARPCVCDRCKIGEPWTSDQCVRCWQYHNNPRYRTLWDGDSVPPIGAVEVVRCPHLKRRARNPDGSIKKKLCVLG